MRGTLLALAFILALPAAAAEGRWQVTAIDGCYVWNPMPRPGDVATWTGACVDGKTAGEGTLVWRFSGQGRPRESRYVGAMRAGLADGVGSMTLADGTRYEGEWRAGVKHGQGTQAYANGDRYKGVRVDGSHRVRNRPLPIHTNHPQQCVEFEAAQCVRVHTIDHVRE